MKSFLTAFAFSLSLLALSAAEPNQGLPIFDGKSFAGWDGDTNRTWRIENGALVGGSLQTQVPQNEFLATTRRYTNFVLRLKFKLVGTEGFINAGVQFRSERVKDPANEMCGYQADIGEGWYGALYDESRRNKVLMPPDPAQVKNALKPGQWNEYEIRCEGPRIRTRINGVPMIDYTEPEATIPQHGRIGLQIHGGAKAVVAYKDLSVEELP
jgi:hypothetical protein